MIDAKRIEEMKRLSAEATEGAWKIGEFETIICTQQGDKIVAEAWRLANGAGEKDAKFIAESRQFVPDIIAAYEEHAKLIRALTINLECIRATCIAAKDNYIEESDIDDILELCEEALPDA